MIFRIHHETQGGHVHCRFFSGPHDGALGKCGELTMRVEEFEQFAWTAPGWVMSKVLEDWPGQTPQRRQRLAAAFKSGKFITHAAPFTLQTDFMEAEELSRGFVFSSSIARKYGVPLPAAMISVRG